MTLESKRIVVGIGGGIAAFKAVAVVRELGAQGAEVRVVMTPSATRFVGPVTFTGITGRAPVVDLWDPSYAGEVHVELSAWADAMLVAPATANLLARAASGMADDAVLATLSCMRAPVLFAPAMHQRIWNAGGTQRALGLLQRDGAHFVGPVYGKLASGEQGMGRMSEPIEIVTALAQLLAAGADLTGRKLLISAGPTVEDLDPVRFLSNRSSGRMGYALAERAAARGAQVTLVSGPVSLSAPRGVTLVPVRSALEMRAAIMAESSGLDAVVMTAAVADYRPAQRLDQKLKKTDTLTLELIKNPDILAELGAARSGPLPVLVGFALETQNVVGYARDKLTRKNVDLVVANHADDGLGGDTNVATLVTRDGDEALGTLSKHALADRILDRVRALLAAGSSAPTPS
jgi:phosphopantothenoylcysteine decarboxylase / phosphopantothenate---cysteine ligase